jgi:alginate O-acetyltransferase complex protein AlgJ
MTTDTLALPPVPPPAPGDHPLRDRIIAGLFAIAIAGPGLALIGTWSRTMTRFENRPMAPWPAPALTREFAPAFDRAFGDRFGGRDALVRFHHGTLLGVFGVSSLVTVMPGSDGWLYWAGEDGHSLDRHYRGRMPFVQRDVDNTVAEFARRRDWLAARGIAYVVMAVPEKFTIYPEHLPAWIAKSPLPSPYDRVRAGVERDGRVTFVDLRAPLLAAKTRERVYFQTDSHWNYNGAVVAYGELMRAVQKVLPPGTLPTIAPAPRPVYLPGVDFYSGDLVHMLGLPSRIVREDDVAPLSKVLGDALIRCARRIDKDEFPGFEYFVCDRPGLPRAVVLRDSMAISLIPLLSENFSRVVYASTRELDRALIEREKPDIVIEELVERQLHAPGAFPMK